MERECIILLCVQVLQKGVTSISYSVPPLCLCVFADREYDLVLKKSR